MFEGILPPPPEDYEQRKFVATFDLKTGHKISNMVVGEFEMYKIVALMRRKIRPRGNVQLHTFNMTQFIVLDLNYVVFVEFHELNLNEVMNKDAK